jgi:nicotinate phosphoribosyltransferase
VQVKGFEFEVRGNVTRNLEIVGGYSHLDPKVTQTNDGNVGKYMIQVAREQASLWGGKGIGTVPHALIAAYGGNTVLAATKFAEWAPEDLNVTVLVDFENHSVKTALDVARALGGRLWGVRLDTSERLVDRSLWDELGDFQPTGVNERLVSKVRAALDADGYERVKIVVSGGFTAEKIADFEAKGVPVDAYGIGSSLLRGANDFTADVVLTDGRASAKAGRGYRPNDRLELVT